MGELTDQLAQVVMMGIAGPAPSPAEYELIKQGVGGVILFERNCLDPAQVAELIEDLQGVARSSKLGLPLIFAIDQEYGPVTRLRTGITPFPSAWDIGAIGDVDIARREAGIVARELAVLGITLNLAPVADILANPDNRVIGKRSFGANPKLVSAMVGAYVIGLQSEGVAACAKHFPGHGATSVDSHQALPTIERSRKEMDETELIPFQTAIRAGAASIMVGHLLCPALDSSLPATLSPAIIRDLLRKELGYDGVVISDDLLMGALDQWGGMEERGIAAFKAGVDILLIGEGAVSGLLQTLRNALNDRSIPSKRFEEAVSRIKKLKERFPYKGPGDLSGMQQKEDMTFSQELFQQVSDETGNSGDRKA